MGFCVRCAAHAKLAHLFLHACMHSGGAVALSNVGDVSYPTIPLFCCSREQGPGPGPAASSSLSLTLSSWRLAIILHVLQGVLGAGTGAGIIIGSYFAFYSTTKKYLREHTTLKEGSVAFVAGAAAAVGSSFIKVPIAVCIRSVQVGENGGNCPIAYVMLGAYLASSSYCITL